LVGIGYPTSGAVDAETAYKINRTRDYTPVASDKGYPKDIQKYSGGAEAFARFIEQELVTAIDGRYPTVRGDRTIVGHSYGSLFATWAILTNPALFRRAILVSPSYWYADEWIFDYEAKRAADLESLPVLAYLTAGRRETSRTRDIVEGVRRMTRILRSRGYAGLTVRTEIEWREEHYSVFPGALSTGLRFVFGTL
jgi:hypothetical protein